MQGLMMDTQLVVSMILRHAERNFPDREIVSITADNPAHRYTYSDCCKRTRKLANALEKLGVRQGDRVATLAWNDYRHLEAYYAIGGSGFVCHTINPRLFPEQIAFIINHAEDRFIMTDLLLVPLLEKLAPQLPILIATGYPQNLPLEVTAHGASWNRPTELQLWRDGVRVGKGRNARRLPPVRRRCRA